MRSVVGLTQASECAVYVAATNQMRDAIFDDPTVGFCLRACTGGHIWYTSKSERPHRGMDGCNRLYREEMLYYYYY